MVYLCNQMSAEKFDTEVFRRGNRNEYTLPNTDASAEML